jgi:hypothetical protein
MYLFLSTRLLSLQINCLTSAYVTGNISRFGSVHLFLLDNLETRLQPMHLKNTIDLIKGY